MARTAFFAPAHRVLGRSQPGAAAPGNFPDAAPSLDYGGSGVMDPRLPWNSANSAAGAQVLGWLGGGTRICVCDQVPSTISTTNIAVAANVVANAAMVLRAATGAGITVVGASGFKALPSLNLVPAAALAIDGLPGYLRLGIRDYTAFYDPTTGISRAVSITAAAGAAGGDFALAGYDWYGYPQTETVTHAGGATTKNSDKTWKFVTSATPLFTDAHNYSVGTSDIYGLQLAADFFAYAEIYWVSVLQLLATFTAADATSPATTTTNDVRGTFTAGSASDGAKRLQMFVTPSAARLTQTPMSTGLFGVTPA